jgi:hypothetical protein
MQGGCISAQMVVNFPSAARCGAAKPTGLDGVAAVFAAEIGLPVSGCKKRQRCDGLGDQVWRL